MNGIRPQELLEILCAMEASAVESGPAVLATFVSLDGSVFSRAGAMAVFVPAASSTGSGIAWTELQGVLRDEIEAAAGRNRSHLCSLDLEEDDPVLGFGLGAPGRVEVMLEPVTDGLRQHLAEVREALLRGEGVVCSLEIEGPDMGRRTVLRADDPQVQECYKEFSPELVESSVGGAVVRTFLCPLQPMGKAMVFGSGPVAAALCRHLRELGFSVFAADPRPGRMRGRDWRMSAQTSPDGRQHGDAAASPNLPGVTLIEGGWDQARAAAQPDEETAVVVLTRNYALDLETLQGALKSPASYVGVIGPQKRNQMLLAELSALEATPRPGVFFAPAGLDIGAETAAETALAIAAEILAARFGRKGGRLSSRKHAPEPAAGRARVPGLILAAGAGTRFAGGHK
ncbi:MAG: XdhC family protein, partial [Elusimicrobiota bacterium]